MCDQRMKWTSPDTLVQSCFALENNNLYIDLFDKKHSLPGHPAVWQLEKKKQCAESGARFTSIYNRMIEPEGGLGWKAP